MVAADNFQYFAAAGFDAQGTTSLNTRNHLNITVKQPYGVVGCIIPWNAPLIFFSFKVAPALAAGNTVVLKSSEKAPLTVSFRCFLLGAPWHPLKDGIVCVRCHIGPEGWLPTWCFEHHHWLRRTHRGHYSLAYGCSGC